MPKTSELGSIFVSFGVLVVFCWMGFNIITELWKDCVKIYYQTKTSIREAKEKYENAKNKSA